MLALTLAQSAVAGMLLSALLSAVLLWCIAVVVVARMRLKPPRMTDGKALYRLGRVSPADLNLPYENVTFDVPDTPEGILHLKAWWIPAANNSARTVVILHGYADAKVGALAWVPFLHDAGYNTLLYDARAHGESDGRYCTAGFFERHDLIAVMRQLRSARPDATRLTAILGLSMGGATALAAGIVEPVADAVIIDSVYGDYWTAGTLHARLFGLPGPSILLPATWLAQRLSGACFSEVCPADTIQRQAQPTLLIQPANEQLIHPAAAALLRNRLNQSPAASRCQSLVVAGATHVTALLEAPDIYQSTILAFLDKTLTGQSV